MTKHIIIGVLLVGALAGGAFVFDTLRAKPPPGAVFVPRTPQDAVLPQEATPMMLIGEVTSIRNPTAREQAGLQWQGMWTPEPGWSGPVVETTKEKDGTAIRIYQSMGGTMVSGGYFLIAVCPELGAEVKKGDVVWFEGQVDRVDLIPGDLVPQPRIVLRNCRVLRHEQH